MVTRRQTTLQFESRTEPTAAVGAGGRLNRGRREEGSLGGADASGRGRLGHHVGQAHHDEGLDHRCGARRVVWMVVMVVVVVVRGGTSERAQVGAGRQELLAQQGGQVAHYREGCHERQLAHSRRGGGGRRHVGHVGRQLRERLTARRCARTHLLEGARCEGGGATLS